MRQSSDLFSPTLSASHTVFSAVGAFYGQQSVLDNIAISDGSLSVDSSQLIRGDLSITVPRFYTGADGVRRDLLPSGETDAFGTNGQQLALSYTIGRPGGFRETIQLGWYRISDWAEDGANVNVTATSLEALIDEYKFLATQEFAPGTTVAQIIRTLLNPLGSRDILPWHIQMSTGTVLTGRVYEDNRLEALSGFLSQWRYNMWVDDHGILQIGPALSDTDYRVVGSLVDGENGTIVESPTQGTRDGVYNAVVASGEANGDVAPVTATAYLGSGPRAWNGPYGNVPYFYVSPNLTTVAQCLQTARDFLADLQKTARPVTITAIPDPRYEVGDVLSVSYRGRSTDVRIDAITLPLTAGGGAMTISGHELRVV